MSDDEAFAWIQEFPGAVTVCDRDGKILAMNDKSIRTFQDSGGAALIGSNLFDCHPEPSRTRLKELLDAGRTNVYTIEKKGIKKLIYQSPWYVKGTYRGFVELSLEIPAKMPHFVRGEG
jgi:transcriptional regulator with PAS, ATPase and Fis domain